jgi:CBS domain-containing protein
MKTIEKLTARDIMHADVVSVTEDMGVKELAGLLTDRMISGAPVINAYGRLSGVVSLTDIVANEGKRNAIRGGEHVGDFFLQGWEDDLDETEMRPFHVVDDDDMSVVDIMTSMVYSVDESAGLGEMADIMIKGRIHRLLVTREDELVGIVSTLDMLRALRSALS